MSEPDAADRPITDRDPEGVAVTRFEEELSVTGRWAPTGRVRLAKRIVTETVTRTFVLRREELVVERLDAEETSGVPAAGEPEAEPPREFVLRREEVVAEPVVVAYERVLVHKDRVREQRTLEDVLRQERVDVIAPDSDAEPGSPRG